MVIVVGKLVQFPVTPTLVQFTVAPPALPETANVPVHAPPTVDVELKVNVPEKLLVVVVPETVPLPCDVPQVPDTEVPACVRFMTIAMM
jgi:hypothetical protein